jgi:major membrane immunogen (membrane-anchored lipoprotein)
MLAAKGKSKMKSNLIKVVLIAGALLLSACSGSGMSTSTCFSDGCQQFDGRGANKVNFGGSAIGSNFNEYSSGLLHD